MVLYVAMDKNVLATVFPKLGPFGTLTVQILHIWHTLFTVLSFTAILLESLTI